MKILRAYCLSAILALASVFAVDLLPAQAATSAPQSYSLLSGSFLTGSIINNPEAGGYSLVLPTTFNSATLTLLVKQNIGGQTTSYAYTSRPATDPCISIPAGVNIQMTVSGGTPSGPTLLGSVNGSCGASGGGGGGAVTGALGSFVDGAIATIGAEADSQCGSDAGTCTLEGLVKRMLASITALNGKIDTLNTNVTSPQAAGSNLIGVVTAAASGAITNPTSTLTVPATTTAYTAGQLIASSATAGSVVVPSFAIANSAGGAIITRLRLTSNDATSTAWGAQQIQIDLWSAAPTFTNGDRGAFAVATGAAGHLASFSCTMSAELGDGLYSECTPLFGTSAIIKLASGTSAFWTLKATTGSGVTGASKVFTVAAEELN